MKISEAAKKIISAVAPTIATALGGPLAGAATAQLVARFGDEKAAESALASASPETIVQLRQLEIEFQKFLAQNEIDLEQVHQNDRASARLREVAVKDNTPQLLAFSYLGIFLAVLMMQFWIIIDAVDAAEGALRILDGMTGILGTLVIGSKDYYFGSSVGSKQKTELMGQK
jgi:hypothetical protein